MKDYEIITTDWNGIKLEIRWMRNYLRYDDETTIAHLEVESLSPRRAPLPFTETGYKSHFIPEQEVARYGGAIEYVECWLAETSKSHAWKQAAAARNQLSLF